MDLLVIMSFNFNKYFIFIFQEQDFNFEDDEANKFKFNKYSTDDEDYLSQQPGSGDDYTDPGSGIQPEKPDTSRREGELVTRAPPRGAPPTDAAPGK